MSCSGCEKNLKSAIERIPGVQTATADLKTKTAEITPEKGEAIELTQLKKAVEDNELTLKKIEVTAVGQIVSQKERLALKTNGTGQLFILLENSQLEQLEKIISQGSKEFILRGIATLYKGCLSVNLNRWVKEAFPDNIRSIRLNLDVFKRTVSGGQSVF